LKDELEQSRDQLESELRRPCRLLAYPYGEEDSRVRTAARKAGYDVAFGLGPRRNPVDLYAFPPSRNLAEGRAASRRRQDIPDPRSRCESGVEWES
jgi:peptidoglycan/xylan/chitin deacetylase (PgdA/CDA1 family)